MKPILISLPLLALLAACEMPANSAAPPGEAGTCGAEGYASLVGTNIAAVTLPAGLDMRIIGPDTVVTMDYQPGRLNFYVTEGGVVERVTCG